MKGPPPPEYESRRLEELEGYGILDTAPEQAYDDITFLASQICETPIALVSLVDGERQWFKSRVGLEVSETPRDLAFCGYAIHSPTELLVVPNATEDERFADNPLVTQDPSIRFYAGAPLRTPGGNALGTLCVIDRTPREMNEDQKKALVALSRQVMVQLELRRAVEDLRTHSAELRTYQARLERYHRRLEETNESLAAKCHLDGLTGLANRAAFDDRLEEEFYRAKRYGNSLSMAILDIDRFKSINDEHGHSVGDGVLKGVAKLLGSGRRACDLVARFGGDEFVAILPDTGREGALILAERFRKVIQDAEWETRSVTVSVGVATLVDEIETCRSFLDAADAALYEAKNAGRNCIEEAFALGSKMARE